MNAARQKKHLHTVKRQPTRHAPASAPAPNRKKRNADILPAWTGTLLFLNVGILLWTLRQNGFSVTEILPLLLATSGIWLLQNLKVTKREVEPVWVIAPIAFTLTLWLSRPTALFALFFAYILSAPTKNLPRLLWHRLQGFALLLAVFLGRVVFDRLFIALERFVPKTTTHIVNLTLPLGSLWIACVCSLVGGLALLSLHTLLDRTSAYIVTKRRTTKQVTQVDPARLLIGITFATLLTPLGMVMGAWSAIPVAALTLLTATNFQSRHKARQLHGSLQVAQAIGRIVTTQTDEDDAAAIGQRFLTLVQNLVPAQTARIWIIDSEKGVLTPCAILTAGRVSVGEQARLGEGIIGNAATHTHPRLIADAAQDLWKARDEDATGSWLLYPIRAKGHLMAVGQWVRPLGQVFTQEEIVRLDTIVPSVAMALENLHIRETMHVLASTDGLTGLWNHRRMKEILREEVRRSSRYHHPISILMMDVDSFKSFNDTYGHPQGDQLLKNVADVLTSVVRTTDFVGRYGGEEFIIVLPETAQHDACKLAERVRKAVETNAVVMIADQPVSRTLSIGVATFPEDALNAPDLVQRADEALYKAKRTGKNRVIWS